MKAHLLSRLKAKYISGIAHFLVSRRTALTLVGIACIGISLRIYRFEDWLLFNPDQARDAMTAYEMTRGSFPLLGPLAGGTEFHLGPITHYFSFLSGLFFGWTPAALAYPDLLFSILTIPLMYVLIAKMFGRNMGLVSAFLTAISGFMVSYGRFQWNPNTMPFFILLFILSAQLVVYENNSRTRLLWAAILGVSIGVGVQLHTFLLILMPVLAGALFVFLVRSRSFSGGVFALTITVALLLNIPQFVSEFRSNFSNTSEFFSGAHSKTGSVSSQMRHIAQDSVCHIRSYAFILTALGGRDVCDQSVSTIEKKPWKNPVDTAHALLETTFFAGGLFLLVSFMRKALRLGDKPKAFLFGSVLIYSSTLFFLIIPVSNEITVRYFLADILTPFAMLAAWGTFLIEKGCVFRLAAISAFILLVLANGFFLRKEYGAFQSGQVSDGSRVVWGEAVPLIEFIDLSFGKREVAYITGTRSYRQRFIQAIQFSLLIKGKTIRQWKEADLKIHPGPIFSIQKRTKNFEAITEINDQEIINRVASGRVSMFQIREYGK